MVFQRRQGDSPSVIDTGPDRGEGIPKRRAASVAAFAWLGMIVSIPAAADPGIPVAPGELEAALAGAVPGDTIIVADGICRDLELELSGRGTVENPVTIRAQSPGGVIFSGRSGIRLRGEHVVLDGFWFRERHAPEKTVIDIGGAHCRFRVRRHADPAAWPGLAGGAKPVCGKGQGGHRRRADLRRGHLVTGNAFIGLTGRGGAALSLMVGEPEPKPSGYQPVVDATIEGNLFAANRGPAIRLDE